MKKEKTVSLCMIVKNEEHHLNRCLNSVKNLVDEMIIVDTGSTDNTIDIAKKFHAKVYHYKWTNNFADARNESLKHATGDWILLMDADDEFNIKDYDKFIQLINTSTKDGHYFNTVSYVGNQLVKDEVYNLNIRLLRNNKKYQFSGAIHEQLLKNNGQIDYKDFSTNDINIFHYGYLQEVVDEKDKRKRNISIIKKELEKDPLNNFHKFNLGNEYFALGDQRKALEQFDEVYQNFDPYIGYSSKLAIRRIMCFDELKEYNHALKAIEEGLSFYPKFTDLEFIRGWIYLKQDKFTLSIDSFNKCIEMGTPPTNLIFLNGCGTYRAYEALGEIYYQLEDYQKALSSFKNTLKLNAKLTKPIYKITSILNKTEKNPQFISYQIAKYFNLEHVPNLILIGDALLNEDLYDLALGYIEKAEEQEPNHDTIKFIKGKLLYYLKDYEEAKKYFIQTDKNESLIYLLIINFILKGKDFDFILNKMKEKLNDLYYNVCYQLYDLYMDNDTNRLQNFDGDKSLSITIKILEEIIRVQEFKLFENFLPILNVIESKKVLLELAKLYYRRNFKDLAIEEIFHSIKEFDLIDLSCIHILLKESDNR